MEEHGDKAIKIEENKTIVEEINNENEILKNIEEGYEEKGTKETRKSRREKAKESKRKATIAIMITLIICSLIIFSIIFALLNIKNTNILSGISILNIDVSEMSKEEALQKVNDIINEKFKKESSNEKAYFINFTGCFSDGQLFIALFCGDGIENYGSDLPDGFETGRSVCG